MPNSELERMKTEAVRPVRVNLEVLTNSRKTCQDSRCLGRDLKEGPKTSMFLKGFVWMCN
jgi:hypothetical protein